MTKLSSESERRVVELLRAMLGCVSWNFRAIWMDEPRKDLVILRFLLEKDEDEDREEIEDLVFEFESMQENVLDLEVESEIYVSSDPLPKFKDFGYLVYARA